MFHGGGNVQHPQYLQHPQHPQHQYQQQYQHQYQPQPSWGGGAASGWAFPAFPNGPMAPQVSRPSAAGPPAMPPAAMMMFPEEVSTWSIKATGFGSTTLVGDERSHRQLATARLEGFTIGCVCLSGFDVQSYHRRTISH